MSDDKFSVKRIEGIKINYTIVGGPYIIIYYNGKATEAIEFWEELIKNLKAANVPIFVAWKGEWDLTEKEIAAKLSDIFESMGFEVDKDMYKFIEKTIKQMAKQINR